MAFPNYKDLAKFQDPLSIENEIYALKKSLFEKKLANETIKPHVFTHTKRRLAQLYLKKSILLKKKEG